MIPSSHHLSDDSSTGLGLDELANAAGRVGSITVSVMSHHGYTLDSRVAVGRSEFLLLGDLGVAVGKDVVLVGGETLLLAVEVGDDGALDVVERVLLDEHLGAHAGVDTGGGNVLVAAAVDVGGAEAHRGSTRVDVGPVVVVVGDVELASVISAGVVAVADQAGLPVVGELGPADGDKVGASLGVAETVVEVLVTGDALGREVAVVDPDVGGALNVDQILTLGRVAHLEVTEDDVGHVLHAETTADETW